MTPPAPFVSWHEHLKVALPGAQVVFTTRRGGFSSGPYESLNLGRLTQDRRQDVEQNRRQLASQVGRRLAMVRQVHGSTLHVAGETWPGQEAPPGSIPEGDGIVTSSEAVAAAVLTADCLPVALAGGGVVAMLHAGWRGLAAGILTAGVQTLRERGAQGDLHAVIGPGVGVCCYEVGEEVHQAFRGYGPQVRRGANLDLQAVAAAQLHQAGVRIVHDIGLCTSCSPELFFSHRRDRGVTGRQAGVVWSS